MCMQELWHFVVVQLVSRVLVAPVNCPSTFFKTTAEYGISVSYLISVSYSDMYNLSYVTIVPSRLV